MSDPDRSGEAERVRLRRARWRRDKLAANVGVLDGLMPEGLPGRPTSADVAAFFGVDVARVQALVRSHRDEITADGWRPTNRSTGEGDYWPPRAIVRAGLLLDGTVAEELRYRLGQGDMPVAYSTNAARVTQCRALYERANRVAGQVRDHCPDGLWRELENTDRYQLQALVVALAALVPIDQGGLARWLVQMSALDGRGGSVARGLALLVPERAPWQSARTPREGAKNVAVGAAHSAR